VVGGSASPRVGKPAERGAGWGSQARRRACRCCCCGAGEIWLAGAPCTVIVWILVATQPRFASTAHVFGLTWCRQRTLTRCRLSLMSWCRAQSTSRNRLPLRADPVLTGQPLNDQPHLTRHKPCQELTDRYPLGGQVAARRRRHTTRAANSTAYQRHSPSLNFAHTAATAPATSRHWIGPRPKAVTPSAWVRLTPIDGWRLSSAPSEAVTPGAPRGLM
jgi:hypothetical protein